jgi:hypothetical protein
VLLDDVIGAKIDSVKMVKPEENNHVIKLLKSSGVSIQNSMFYKNKWEQSPTNLRDVKSLNYENNALLF